MRKHGVHGAALSLVIALASPALARVTDKGVNGRISFTAVPP